MGQISSTMYNTYYKNPDTSPNVYAPPTYPTDLGFSGGREERHPVATEEEMEAAGIEPYLRDYCAHLLIEFRRCRQAHFPWVIACKPQKHHWEECEADDYILRMKEYERERRLMERAKAKKLHDDQMRSVHSKEVLAE